MRNSRIASIGRFIGIAALPLAIAAASSVAGAQYQNGSQYPDRQYPDRRDRNARGNGQQELFEWAGRVDREIRIQAGRGSAQIINMGSNERNNGGRFRSMNLLPSRDGTVTVQVLEGRGRVDVIQQPSRRNGYTTVVRLRDPDGGAARYRIAAYYQPNGNNNGGYRRN
jgi:hypothetical protein